MPGQREPFLPPEPRTLPAPAQAHPTCTACGHKPTEALNFCPKCGNDLRGLSGVNDTLSGSFVGKVIADRYKILEKLGEGGMGSVFKVEHVRMGKVMALKLMRQEFTRDKQAVERFVAEAQIVSRLSHIHTISVFDFGEAEDGSLFIAMEYCPGKDLSWNLRVEGRLPERRAAVICAQILRSLAEAHDAGIVHRDVKPGNVMLLKSREGEDFVKVLDFGIAKLAQPRAAGGPAITGSGDFVGTPNYMAPEQARGTDVGPQADLYALGAMLFELVTGRIPFNAPTPMGIITAHVTEPAPHPREIAPEAGISPAMEAVILRALEKDPKRRFPSADAMREALESSLSLTSRRRLTVQVDAITDEGPIASREDWDNFEKRLKREIGGRSLLGALVVVALFALGAAGVYFRVEISRFLRAGGPVAGSELEPNNTSGDANSIATGVPVSGTMMGRFDTEGDRDTFEVDLPPGEQVVTVRLTPIRDINLLLYLFDGAGKPLQKIDRAPAGGGEVASRVRASEKLFVQVRQNPDGGAPKENSVDAYTVQVDLLAADPQFELEPNDEPAQAGELVPGSPRKGIADAKGARDVWKVTLPEGPREVAGVIVTGVPGADLALLAVEDLEAAPKKPVDEQPAGAGELLALGPKVSGTLHVFVDVVAGAEHDTPYELTAFADDGAALLAAVGRLRVQGRFLDVAALSSRAVARYPRAVVAAELLWLTGEAAALGAAELTVTARAQVGVEPDPKKREAAFKALPAFEDWSRAGVPLRYSPAQGGFAYGGDAFRKLLSVYPASNRAEAAAAALVTLEASPCGAAGVDARAAQFLDRFPEGEHRSQVLLALGRAREDLGVVPGAPGAEKRKAAAATYKQLVADFPGSVEAQAAKERLDALKDPKKLSSALYFPCD